jgi:hypothetical protein
MLKPFHYFNSSPNIISLIVMMYIRLVTANPTRF